MAEFFENLGMEFVNDDEETFMKITGYAAENATPIVGYYGQPYLNYHFGSVQTVLRTELNDEEHRLELIGVDTHISSNAVWDVRCNGMDITPKGADRLEKRCVFSDPKDGNGMLVINVINADVIPSYLEDDIIKMQVAAFPVTIDYFKDEEAYSESMPKDELGKRWGVSEGSLFPVGFMSNRSPKENDEEDHEKDEWLDNIMLLCGKIKSLHIGKVKIAEQEYNGYIICKIETMYGDLDIVHTIDQVDETQRDNIEVGAIVSAQVVLSGDVAIYDYEKGIIKDKEHNLRLMRSVLNGEDPERLRMVLDPEANYVTDIYSRTYAGADAVIGRIKEVHETGTHKYYTYLATITEIDENDKTMEPVDTRCIVLACDSKYNYESIAFINCNDEGNITELHTSTDIRYKFKLDESPLEVDPFEGIHVPETYIEAMIARANYHGFIDRDTDDETAIKSDAVETHTFRNNVQRMLAAWPGDVERWDEEYLRRLFGYLFAKAIESCYSSNQDNPTYENRLIASYKPGYAWDDDVNSEFDEELHKKIELAMKYGKQFYTDFSNYYSPEDEGYEEELEKALIFVQRIANFCAMDYMNREEA